MQEQVKKLQELLRENDSAGAVALLEATPELLEEKTESGMPLLLLAAYYRNQEVLDVFVKHRGSLTIFEAAAIGNSDMVRSSLEKNANLVNAFSSDGFTPLGLSSYFGHLEVTKLLVNKGANVNICSNNSMKVAPIHSAVASKNLLIAELLLQNGADVNAKQAMGATPLHSAAHQGDIAMVKLLLSFDADTNAQMENGKKPLDFAKEDNNLEVAALLEK